MVLMMLLQPSSSCVSQARMWNKSAQKARSCTVHNPVAAECWKQTKNSWRTLQHVASNEPSAAVCSKSASSSFLTSVALPVTSWITMGAFVSDKKSQFPLAVVLLSHLWKCSMGWPAIELSVRVTPKSLLCKQAEASRAQRPTFFWYS